MELIILPFVGAILLLYAPSWLFLTRNLRRRLSELQWEGDFYFLQIFAVWQNWLDLIRGYAGAFLLYHHAFPLNPEMEDAFYTEFWTVVGVLAGAILVNTYYFRRRLYCLAPLFLVTGIVLAVFEWWIVLYGIVTGLVLTRVLNVLEIYFAAMAIVIVVAGLAFDADRMGMLMISVLLFFPVILAFCSKRWMIAVSIPVERR